MGKLSISMAMFNGYVKLPNGTISWNIRNSHTKGSISHENDHQPAISTASSNVDDRKQNDKKTKYDRLF